MFEDRCDDSTLNGRCKQLAFRNPISNRFSLFKQCYFHDKKTRGLIHTQPDLILVWDEEE
jgi:hypothetical protein